MKVWAWKHHEIHFIVLFSMWKGCVKFLNPGWNRFVCFIAKKSFSWKHVAKFVFSPLFCLGQGRRPVSNGIPASALWWHVCVFLSFLLFVSFHWTVTLSGLCFFHVLVFFQTCLVAWEHSEMFHSLLIRAKIVVHSRLICLDLSLKWCWIIRSTKWTQGWQALSNPMIASYPSIKWKTWIVWSYRGNFILKKSRQTLA